MAELKTKPTGVSVRAFVGGVEEEEVRGDCMIIAALMEQATKAKPKMWGDSIVGFGSYHYVYASGRTGDCMLTGFSPKKRRITIYIMSGLDRHAALLEKLGPHSRGKSCLHLRRLSDVHLPTLKRLLATSVRDLRRADKAAHAPASGRSTRLGTRKR